MASYFCELKSVTENERQRILSTHTKYAWSYWPREARNVRYSEAEYSKAHTALDKALYDARCSARDDAHGILEAIETAVYADYPSHARFLLPLPEPDKTSLDVYADFRRLAVRCVASSISDRYGLGRGGEWIERHFPDVAVDDAIDAKALWRHHGGRVQG